MRKNIPASHTACNVHYTTHPQWFRIKIIYFALLNLRLIINNIIRFIHIFITETRSTQILWSRFTVVLHILNYYLYKTFFMCTLVILITTNSLWYSGGLAFSLFARCFAHCFPVANAGWVGQNMRYRILFNNSCEKICMRSSSVYSHIITSMSLAVSWMKSRE